MICTNVVRTNGLGLTFHVSVKLCKSILCCVVNVNVEINTHIILHDHLNNILKKYLCGFMHYVK